MVSVMVVLGTRPEAIKLAPLIKALERKKGFQILVVATGQHREMLAEALDDFGVHAQYNLAIMRKGQTLAEMTSAVLEGLSPLLDKHVPDLVLVHGDTTTAFACALCAFYRGIAVGHIEAGLRTYDLQAPFPEEYNRRAISLMASYHFAPTEWAAKHLLREGVPRRRVFVTGNTGMDALKWTLGKKRELALLSRCDGKRILLLTAHRRENWGNSMRGAFCGILRVLESHPDTLLVYPVHKNPQVRSLAHEVFSSCERAILCEPMVYSEFCHLLSACYLVLTDSGGLQEEAPYLGKPVLVLRDKTERPEGVAAGVLRLVGCEEESVAASLNELLDDEEAYRQMSRAASPYGDGNAAERIADILERELLGE